MANKPSNTILIAAAVLAIGGISVSNELIKLTDPKVQEQREREREEKRAAEEAKKAQNGKSATPAPEAPQPAAGAGDASASLTALGEETVLGKPDAAREVTIRWMWTPTVQSDPSTVNALVENVKKTVPDARIRVLNIDDQEGASKPGLYVGESLRLPANPDGTFPPIPGSALGPLMK